jgi:hypothetical protein
MLSGMKTPTTSRELGREDATTSSEPAYEDSWYRVLKRLSEERASDDAAGDDAEIG